MVDDHQVIIDALSEILNKEPDIEIVGKAQSPDVLYSLLRHKSVDIIVMDVEMPLLDGIELTRLVKEKHPTVRVLMLTQHNKRGLISHAIGAGADGYILKSDAMKTLISGIRSVYEGKFFTGGIKLPSYSKPIDAPELTEREEEIICLIVEEKTSLEIASELNLSPNTVNQHRKNIMSKLNVKSVVGIVKYALDRGLCGEG